MNYLKEFLKVGNSFPVVDILRWPGMVPSPKGSDNLSFHLSEGTQSKKFD